MIRILVVDDDANLNRSVCTYLNDSGYQAKGCLSADSAYDAMYGSLYDLIISDIMMPGTDGFEFAGTVRGLNKTVPILFMSARDDLPAKQKGFDLGIDDYMVKPIDFSELLMRVRALLRRANIEASRRITVGNLTLNAGHDRRGGRRRGAGDYPGVQHPLQAAVLPQQDLLPGAADGRILGCGIRDQPAGGGRLHHQAAGQVLHLRRLRDQNRPGPGL